jgi:hypothetical protein
MLTDFLLLKTSFEVKWIAVVMLKTLPLPNPPSLLGPTIDSVVGGLLIAPIDRLRYFSPIDWENFVLEWAHSLQDQYSRVDRCGGAGDMGRDVIAIPDECDPTRWSNFQCKHYDHPLAPSDIWLELGKLVYYTYKNEFTFPTKYYFVAPQGVSTKLSKLFAKPSELKAELIEKWNNKCRLAITTIQEVLLEGDLREYIETLDFSIISYIPPLQLLDQHRTTPWHVARFGGGLPPRPIISAPPEAPADFETVYLKKIFDAYSDARGVLVRCFDDIKNDLCLAEHYKDSRIEFYSAESLRSFSRDTLPDGVFEALQDEIYSGIKDIIRGKHESGYRRLLAVIQTARTLQLISNALLPRMHNRDRGGICHQLANDRTEVKWVINE